MSAASGGCKSSRVGPTGTTIGSFCLDNAILAVLKNGDSIAGNRKKNGHSPEGLGGATFGGYLYDEHGRRVIEGRADAPEAIKDPQPFVYENMAGALLLVKPFVERVRLEDKLGIFLEFDLLALFVDLLMDKSAIGANGWVTIALATCNVDKAAEQPGEETFRVDGKPLDVANPAAFLAHNPKYPRGRQLAIRMSPDGKSRRTYHSDTR
jgi:hypothetical protein